MIAAVILGIIQGLTEFLPVSSSAHLILVPWVVGWHPEGLVFDVALHVGTAVALLVYFWRDWIDLAHEGVAGLVAGEPLANPKRRLAWFLVVATIPAAVVGLALEDLVEAHLRSPLVIVVTLIVFGLVLRYAELRGRQTRTLERFTWGDAVSIGLAQALALVPGVSRSGVTISAALLRDAERPAAARFSFLLSTPVILGGGLREGWKLVRLLQPAAGASAPETVALPVLAVGTASAAVTGFLCIRFFMRYLEDHTFAPFVYYRCALAAVVLVLWLKFS